MHEVRWKGRVSALVGVVAIVVGATSAGCGTSDDVVTPASQAATQEPTASTAAPPSTDVTDADRTAASVAIKAYVADCYKGYDVQSISAPTVHIMVDGPRREVVADFELTYDTVGAGIGTRARSLAVSEGGQWRLFGDQPWGPACSPGRGPDLGG